MRFYKVSQFVAFIGLLNLLAPQYALANSLQQDTKSVNLSNNCPVVPPATKKGFWETLQEIAAASKVTFVVEGEPLPLNPKETRNTDEEVKAASKISLRDFVEQIAQTHDYSVTRQGRIFLLKKRYSNAADFPPVLPEEAKSDLDDVLKLVADFRPKYPPSLSDDRGFQSFWLSLTPEQWGLMKEGKLPVSSLSREQQEEIWRLSLDSWLSWFIEMKTTAARNYLDVALDEKAVVRWTNLFGEQVFGVYLPPDPQKPDSERFTPISTATKVTLPGMSREAILSNNGASPADVTTPDAESVADAAARTEMMPTAPSTLGSVITALNERNTNDPTLMVEEVLAEKPVHVIGGENALPQEIFSACAELYGLRIVTENKTGRRITRPYIPRPSNVFDLWRSMRRAVPEPYLRVIHAAELDRINAEIRESNARFSQEKAEAAAQKAVVANGVPLPRPSAEQIRAKMEEEKRDAEYRAQRKKEFAEWATQPVKKRSIALKYLRTVLEPKVKASPNGEIPVSSLSATEKAALTAAMMGICMPELQSLLFDARPAYIRRFSELYIQGSPYYEEDGSLKLSISLGFPNPDGGDLDLRIGHAYISPPKELNLPQSVMPPAPPKKL